MKFKHILVQPVYLNEPGLQLIKDTILGILTPSEKADFHSSSTKTYPTPNTPAQLILHPAAIHQPGLPAVNEPVTFCTWRR